MSIKVYTPHPKFKPIPKVSVSSEAPKSKSGFSKTIKLQATQLENFDNCQLNFWHKNIFYKSGNFESGGGGNGGEASVRGTTLHQSVERFLTEYVNNSFLPKSRLLEIFTQQASQSLAYGQDLDFLARGLPYVESFHKYFVEDQAYDIRTFALEKEVKSNVKYRGLSIKLAGRIDHLNWSGDLIDINDWKFPEKSKRVSIPDKKRGLYQVSAYAHLLNRNDIGEMILFDVTPSGVIKNSWKYSESVNINVENLYKDIIDKTILDLAKPTEWQPVESESCNYCFTKRCDHCPLKKGGSLPKNSEIKESQGVQLWAKLLDEKAV